ncbi:hypothetical protein PLICRDRAFT_177318 [Plicaturopsis crispa FD-325 SS-3]|nr:hypothetical protein PLICRDRAFT_177318 [Plicaturopsis crispa FD-325 SS-3]
MPKTYFPFHGLPDELILHIFRLAAASSWDTCLALMLVASWTRHLAVPHLLKTVVIRSEAAAIAFVNFLDQDPRRAPLVKAVSFAFAGDDRGRLSYDIVQRCPNLTNIAMIPEAIYGFVRWRATDASAVVLPSHELHLTVPAPQIAADGDSVLIDSLVSAVVEARYSRLPMPILERITHLDTTVCPSWFRREKPFGAFTHLTHVRVDLHSGPRGDIDKAVTAMLRKHGKIKMLVLSVEDVHYREDVVFAEWFWGTRDQTNERLYATSGWNTLEEWERAARDGNDIWDDAFRETEDWRCTRALRSF